MGGSSAAGPRRARNRKRKARSDLPVPEGPRSRAAVRPSATQVPCASSVASGKGQGSLRGRHIGGREPHEEGGSSRRGRRALGACRVVWPKGRANVRSFAVYRPDAAAVSVDDFARDAEAEPRILAQRAVGLRPIRIEALEDVLKLVGGNSGTL